MTSALCPASPALAMAAPWEDVLGNEPAIREAAAVAVDAALLEGVLMRTEGQPNASDVSAGAVTGRVRAWPGAEAAKREERGGSRLPSRALLGPVPGSAGPSSVCIALQ